MTKFLIIRLSSMGDVLLTSPIVQALRKSHPDAIIDFVVKKQFAAMIQYNPDVNSVLILDSQPGALKTLREAIKKNGYDVILDLHRNFRSHYLKSNSGAGIIHTLKKEYLKRYFLVNWKINLFGKKSPTILDRYAITAGAFLRTPISRFPSLSIPDSVIHSVQSTVATWKHPRIVVVPGSAHPTKEWPVNRFGETGLFLKKKYNAEIIIVGGSDNKPAGDRIGEMIGSQSHNFAGKTSLLETASIINESDLLITGDTGCMHIGWAFRKKMVCIFGSTVRALGYYPEYNDVRIVENSSLKCRPCSHNGRKRCPKGHFRCMNDITVEQVVKVAEELIVHITD